MGTNELHPMVRRAEQHRKKLLRRHKNNKKIPHHTRKWWKAWHKTWLFNFLKRQDLLDELKEKYKKEQENDNE